MKIISQFIACPFCGQEIGSFQAPCCHKVGRGQMMYEMDDGNCYFEDELEKVDLDDFKIYFESEVKMKFRSEDLMVLANSDEFPQKEIFVFDASGENILIEDGTDRFHHFENVRLNNDDLEADYYTEITAKDGGWFVKTYDSEKESPRRVFDFVKDELVFSYASEIEMERE